MRWPNLQRIQFGKPAQTVNPATVASPEILPISPRRCVFSLDKSLSWMSNDCSEPIFSSKVGEHLSRAVRPFVHENDDCAYRKSYPRPEPPCRARCKSS